MKYIYIYIYLNIYIYTSSWLIGYPPIHNILTEALRDFRIPKCHWYKKNTTPKHNIVNSQDPKRCVVRTLVFLKYCNYTGSNLPNLQCLKLTMELHGSILAFGHGRWAPGAPNPKILQATCAFLILCRCIMLWTPEFPQWNFCEPQALFQCDHNDKLKFQNST